MAYTVSIAPLAASAVIGTTTKFTATGAGAAAEGTETFVWTVDGVVQSSVAATMDYIAAGPKGDKIVKVVATTTPAEGDPETAEAETTLTVKNKTMSLTLTLSPSSVSQEIGTTTEVTANVAGAPAGYSNTYVWKRNSTVLSGETDKTISVTGSAAASYTLNCEVTTTAPDYDTGTATKGAVVAIYKKSMSGVSVILTPASITAEQDSPAQFKADVAGAPSGASAVYSWKKDGTVIPGETSNTLSIDTSVVGSQVIEVSVVLSATDYNDLTVTKTGDVTVTEKAVVVPDGEIPYIHPLPYRGSAYIWCGWWVMDEIQRMAVAGKDWKTEDPDSDYYLHRYTLSQMLTDYPEVDVQESRHGYVIHRSALELGYIYDYYKF